MKATDNALYTLLTGDATLAAIVTGSWHRHFIKQGVDTIAGVYAQVSAVPVYSLGSARAIDFWDILYIIKTVEKSTSAANGYAAKDRLLTLLNGGSLSLSGYTLMDMHIEQDIEEVEPSDNINLPYQHIGGYFRLWIR